MKKLSAIIGLVLMAALPLMAERVDPETARKVATTFLNNNGAKANQLTDLSKAAGFPNLYIFNANPGFVVMSADDCVKPILGYSLTGRFEAKDMPENLSSWLQGYSEEIQYAIDNQVRASSETIQLWKDLINGNTGSSKVSAVVNNLLSTTWDQDPYYNDLCPYDQSAGELTVTGCVATAMAQIMKYWGYPSRGIGSHSYTPNTHPEYGVQSANYSETTYNWTAMPNYINSANNEIAKLMYHCGVSVDMDYGTSDEGGSSAVTANVAIALQNYFNYQTCSFKYKSDNEDNWTNMLKAELDAHRPLQYSGRGSAGGHSFVCCGYDNNNKFYFNWGWSGVCDGFYSLDALQPSTGGSGSAGLSFNQNQGAIFGIQPSTCNLTPPTDLSFTVEGARSVVLTWGAVSDAISYNIYRNNELIGNTSAATYTDISAPYGTNVYYLRLVDSNNQLSFASNSVNVLISYPTPIVDDLTASLSSNTVTLAWTAPEWCYPETPSATLHYGETNSGYSLGYNNTSARMYWGHCYLSASLSSYNNMSIYKVSFYANDAGSYELFIYQGTNNSHPQTQVYHQSVNVSSTGWFDIDLTNHLLIEDVSQDLWVFIYDSKGRLYPAPYCNNPSANYGNYYSQAPTSYVYQQENIAFLIQTFLTDGIYTYNLYDCTTKLNGNTPISGTSYTVENIANNSAHQYSVTTNYYGGETGASNMVGITLGTIAVDNLVLDVDDIMTVTSGSTLSVTNTLSNDDPANLIIEDGAQLIHHNDGVKATVKRGIEGYGATEGGWYTIAAPFANFNPGEIATDDYDLYYYDEDAEAEWINYKAHPEDFPQALTSGYLYARQITSPVDMTGTLNSGVYTKTVNLSYGNSNASIKGYNLLGNPTAHEITFAKSANVSDGYYYLTNSSSWVYQNNNIVPAGRGFLVKANDADQTVTLNPQSKHDEAKAASLRIDVDGEIAYVKLTEGVSMPLLSFKGKRSNVYLSRDGEQFIMLVKDESEAIDLCYHPSHGTHTLSVTLEDAELDYLHLIDHLTGAEIDLLQSPSYSFESSSSDYPTRFQLVFSAEVGNNTGDDFEFIDGKSQILDMTGRVVATERNTRLAPGVYILRTVNEKETSSQKIIIK